MYYMLMVWVGDDFRVGEGIVTFKDFVVVFGCGQHTVRLLYKPWYL